MLYTESKQYLIDKLKAAGIKSKPFTTEKALEKSQESHIGAVLFERETFTRNGSKKRYGQQKSRIQGSHLRYFQPAGKQMRRSLNVYGRERYRMNRQLFYSGQTYRQEC